MNLTPLSPDLTQFPQEFHSLLTAGPVYDSSCSSRARVLRLEGGFFLKSAPAAALREEADMTRHFHSMGLSAQVLCYQTGGKDWLLTRQVPGLDGTHFLHQPERLCDTFAQILHRLHSCSGGGLPNRLAVDVASARENYHTGNYDPSHFPDNWGYATAEDAWAQIARGAPALQADTLIHGDCCLPNIMLENWRFTGFIDLGGAGLGDRHQDIFWALWSLWFNLKTDRYTQRFLDAYGRDQVSTDALKTVAALQVFL